MIIAEMTKAVLRERNWSVRQAELQTKVGYSTIHNMQAGLPVTLRSLGQFARAVGQDPDVWQVIASTGTPARFIPPADIERLPQSVREEFAQTQAQFRTSETVAIPILGRVVAGSRVLAEENHEGDLYVSRDLIAEDRAHLCFAVRVEGGSMEGAHILSGDMVIFIQTQDADDGMIVAAIRGESIVIKRLRKPEGEEAYLESHYADGARERHALGGDDKIIGAYVSLRRDNPRL